MKSDVWSLGVVLYVLITGTIPFKAGSIAALKQLITKGLFITPVGVSDQARSLLQRMIRVSPRERVSIGEVLDDPWLDQHFLYSTPLLQRVHNQNRHSLVMETMGGYGFPREVVDQHLHT